MRLAGNKLYELAKEAYKSDVGQDLLETSLKQAGVAVGMSALTDMTPEEIILASLIGGSAAMIARPVGKNLGRRVGRKLDEIEGPDAANVLQKGEKQLLQLKDSNSPVLREAADILHGRFMKNYGGTDGKISGDWEAGLGEIARETADDLTQLSLAFALPGLFAREEKETLQ